MLASHHTHSIVDFEAPRESTIEDDIATFTFITSKPTRELELGLFATKWFDYRHITPWQATRLYMQDYEKVYRAVYAANIDYRAAEWVRPVTVEKVMSGLSEASSRNYTKMKSVLTACWHGRQVADHLGMPYEVYIDQALKVRLRYWKQSHLPQARHLYSDLVIDMVGEKWREIQASDLYLSEHPAYRIENYTGAPHQEDYHSWLFLQASLRPNPATLIADLVRQGQMTLEIAEHRLEPEIFEKFRALI